MSSTPTKPATTSPVVAVDAEHLLAAFLRYVKIDTTAGEPGETYPSSPGQLVLGKLLAEELRAIGLSDAEQDRWGIVYATLPSNLPAEVAARVPVVAFNSHVDTSPETTGKDIRPIVHRNFNGQDIALPNGPGLMIRAAENPELPGMVGKTLVTTDGSTLLGSDDKSGIAVIIEAARTLLANPDVPRGTVKLCFTCDEEVGHGVDHVDLKKLGADVCYTLDSAGQDDIDVETFSADQAIVTVRGVNIHPSIAKGRMVNAVRAAADFLARLPRDVHSPETTADRQGFIHPYGISGGVEQTVVRFILRDFDTPQLAVWANMLRDAATATEAAFPGAKITVETSKQYRNLGDGLKLEPRAAKLAEQALRNLGRKPKLTIVRGGTDGSRLTELGLPTPNLSTGEHNPHSPLEWTCLEEMVAATEGVVELVRLWSAERK